MSVTDTKRIWGWYFYDWAAQPISTVIMTFIFAPYFTELVGDGAKAQAQWGYAVGLAGFIVAIFAPIIGAVADQTGRRMPFMWAGSIMYVVGMFGLWYAVPGDYNIWFLLGSLIVGLLGMELGLLITNGMLPDVAGKKEVGRVSGGGFAFGYLGGFIAMLAMLALFAENGETGKTLIGIDPIFGFDASAREGTRFSGPLSAIWYMIFIIPFFLWLKDTRITGARAHLGQAIRTVLALLVQLPKRKAMFSFLMSSMFARDALNGLYFFGGLYAAGVLGWSPVDMGVFGIVAILSGIFFTWLGGFLDVRFGPRTVLMAVLVILTCVTIFMVSVSRETVLFLPVAEGSCLPDMSFYLIGSIVGAAGGILQAVSRTMVVKLSDPTEVTQTFGLYALTGRATAFLAPLSIGIVTDMTGSQAMGIVPLAILFVLGLILLRPVPRV